MNEVLKNIRERRSCRKYKAEPVPQELLDQVIEAGLYAPSSKGQQAAIVVCVTDPAAVKKLSALNARFMQAHTDSDPFYGAPAVLIVLAAKERPAQYCDGCLVMENLMLAAHSLGLASCWIHRAQEMFETDEGQAFLADLGIDASAYIGIGNCIVGYADGDLPAPPARKDGRVFYVK
ncbi:MAG: nitroreductase [Peptococcaceae bacterium]|nr:nitroreductase [Peptococcaceae bacterium]